MGTVTRSNTNTASGLSVTLVSSDTTEARVPNIVVIPAGQSSVRFQLNTVDDTLLDGSQTATITAYAVDYVSGQASVIVDDYETLTLELDSPQLPESAGGMGARLTRSNTDTSAELVVQLTSEPGGLVDMPATVTIPAGSASAGFIITPIDDNLLLGDRQVTFGVNAPGYNVDTPTLTITDSESLTVTLSANSMSERDGNLTGTVRRSNTNLDAELVVQIVAAPAGQISAPGVVRIPAGSASADFTVTAVDDDQLDGDQNVDISVAAIGYLGDTVTVQVTDFETLTVSIPAPPIPEHNGGVVAYVRRNNADLSSPLTVTLSSSDTSEATVPATVTIPANATLATFTILSVDDAVRDGDQTVAITASAAGYESAAGNITVTDDESSFPWNNPRNPLDVNNDTFVTAIDALLVINQINTAGGGKLGVPPADNNSFYDTNADNFITAIDVLLIINHINTHPTGEGESDQPPAPQEPTLAAPAELLPDAKRKAREAFFAELGDA